MDRYLRQAAEKLAEIDKTGSFHKDTVPVLLSLFRQHLEGANLKGRYRITNFYCNWSLHVSLDRGVVQDILQEISDIISDDEDIHPNDRINEVISLRRLRAEIIEILDTIGVRSSVFCTASGWKAFVRALLDSLIGKPLERKRDHSSTNIADRLTLVVPDLSGLDQDFITDYQISANAVFWQVLVLPIRCHLVGPLVLTESPEDFDAS